MSATIAELDKSLSRVHVEKESERSLTIAEVTARVAKRIAPLWPLSNSVAVNPYMGLSEMDFVTAASLMWRVGEVRMTMPREFYLREIRKGRVSRDDLNEALRRAHPIADLPRDVCALLELASSHAPAGPSLPTVADAATELTGMSWDRLVTEQVSEWASTYYDHRQSTWTSPWKHLTPYAAWREDARHNRTPEVYGLRGFRGLIATLPASPSYLTAHAVQRSWIPAHALELYFHRVLSSINGWASYARYHAWQEELAGGTNTMVEEILAVRLAWEVALLELIDGLPQHWETRRTSYESDQSQAVESTLAIDAILQSAHEIAWQRQLVRSLPGPQRAAETSTPQVQAVFCIDVRSEPFRRALESVDASIDTLGFAGFFGFPVSYVPFGETQGEARCPALIPPSFTAHQKPKREDIRDAVERKVASTALSGAERSFKTAAVSCFGFVEAFGLAYVAELLGSALRPSRPFFDEKERSHDPTAHTLEPSVDDPRQNVRTGMTLKERVDTAEGALRGMSLTEAFAPLVAFVGHGATTANNPHAAGLDCGACGGHSGGENARIAAHVLNDPIVRVQLEDRGIRIPNDTIFVGCLHDTTTDDVIIYQDRELSNDQVSRLNTFRQGLRVAGRRTRLERAKKLGIDEVDSVEREIRARSDNWAEVRPELGLAGCSGFIVGPRHLTKSLDLKGEVFLHSYDSSADEDYSVLEAIMTAPMVVTTWINLQYYGSAVDNEHLGAGNKVLHNVVGGFGVQEGSTGDLRVGLPLQSLENGNQRLHSPRRLTVIIRAPTGAMSTVLSRHPEVQALLDNGWISLFAMDESGAVSHRYDSHGKWEVMVPRSQLA